MKKNRIRLTESQLHDIIAEAALSYLRENDEEESLNGFKKAGSTFKNVFKANGDKGFIGRTKKALGNAYDNYKTEGDIEVLRKLQSTLKQAVQLGQISTDQTVGQILGTPGNSLSSKIGRMRSTQTRRGASPVR